MITHYKRPKKSKKPLVIVFLLIVSIVVIYFFTTREKIKTNVQIINPIVESKVEINTQTQPKQVVQNIGRSDEKSMPLLDEEMHLFIDKSQDSY